MNRPSPRVAVVPALAVVLALTGLVGSGHRVAAAAQELGRSAPGPTADAEDVVEEARRAQARFENRRIRLFPVSYGGFGGPCDEVVGRICVGFGEGEWYPEPEDPEIGRLRDALVIELDAFQRLAPASSWILGQRVWYRTMGADWEGAIRTARECGPIERWWCLALEGFALHAAGRYPHAQEAFDEALVRMGPDRARRWRVPRWAVEGAVRDLLVTAEASPFATSGELHRLWALADPLYLVPGNDRLTAHYARWTVTELRDRARNPFKLSWGDDLTQLTVRHGWQMGWERTPARNLAGQDDVVGHDHPLGRDYMPTGAVLSDPAAALPEALMPRVRTPRSLYAPEYAPVMLPMGGQVAVFPRGATMRVVASHFLPEDTTLHADHVHPKPWLEPGDQAGMPDRAGIVAWPVDDPHRRYSATQVGSTEGATLLELPTADHVISVESWSPSSRRAGRLRAGLPARRAPDGVATLSDIVLLRPADREPRRLEDVLGWVRPTTQMAPGAPLAIAWEVAGLGFRPETLSFEISVEPTGRGVFGRIGDFLGVTDPPIPLVIAWQESGPAEPGPLFRYLSFGPTGLEEGEYRVRLVLRTTGRSDVVRVTPFEVVAPR